MNQDEFLTEMNRLRDVFGQNNFSVQRERLIASKALYLEHSEWIEIIDNLISGSRFAPTPNDIFEAIRSFKRAHPNTEEVKSSPYSVKCNDCFDTGLCFIDTMFGESLCYCLCPSGIHEHDRDRSSIPFWNNEEFAALGFTKLSFKVSEFIPSKLTEDIFKLSSVSNWKNKKKLANDFWIKMKGGS